LARETLPGLAKLERNLHHRHIVGKHGVRREVLKETCDELLAFDTEKELIAELHTFVDDPLYNGFGCNYTMGGEGGVPSKSVRKLIGDKLTARWQDPVFRAKHAKAMKNSTKKRVMPPEWCEQKSQSMMGEGNPNFGKPLSRECKQKLSAIRKGKPTWNKGKKIGLQCHKDRQKPVVVTDENGNVQTFQSMKVARFALAGQLGISPFKLQNVLRLRVSVFMGLTFSYPNDAAPIETQGTLS
jgi:hypothetical protein